ncbi:hypothetical protein PJ267_16420 [Arthrobacter sp. OVS8]|nr:hypothetical protein PJ267_16420 [Arthrobacter sp. OVS8]
MTAGADRDGKVVVPCVLQGLGDVGRVAAGAITAGRRSIMALNSVRDSS